MLLCTSSALLTHEGFAAGGFHAIRSNHLTGSGLSTERCAGACPAGEAWGLPHRIAPTRPSIMSDGDTQSAPARACAWRDMELYICALDIIRSHNLACSLADSLQNPTLSHVSINFCSPKPGKPALGGAWAHLRDSLPAQVFHSLVIHNHAVIAHDAVMTVAVVRVQRHICVDLHDNMTAVSKAVEMASIGGCREVEKYHSSCGAALCCYAHSDS